MIPRPIAAVLLAILCVLGLWILTPGLRGEATSAQRLVILYTLDTGTFLASCGCGLGGQAGGLARRATVIEQLRKQYAATLLIDLGNLADKSDKYELLVDVARLIGYDALSPGWADMKLRPELAREAATKGVAVVPDVTGRGTDSPLYSGGRQGRDALVVEVDALGPVAFVAAGTGQAGGNELAGVERIASALSNRPQDAQLVVLISRLGLSADKELVAKLGEGGAVDVIIEADEIASLPDVLRAGETAIVVARRGGQHVGVIEVLPGGEVSRHYWIEVTRATAPHAEVHEVASAFLRAHPESRLAGGAPPPEVGWGYAPAGRCAECHERQVESWRRTGHAKAVETLRTEGRLLPECLVCHSEFVRWNFHFANLPPGGDGVQCSTCHGDGIAHTVSGDKATVFGKPTENDCRECHTAERSPEFDYETYLRRIDHR